MRKKSVVLLLTIAFAVITVLFVTKHFHHRFFSHEENSHIIHTDGDIVVIVEPISQTSGVCTITNCKDEPLFCSKHIELQYCEEGIWYKVEDNHPNKTGIIPVESGESTTFVVDWFSNGRHLPSREYRLVLPIKFSGSSYWIAAPFTIS